MSGLQTGMLVDLVVDRAVPGGRMLARHEGRVVLVSGTIPGERVRARIERATKSVVFAEVVDVIDASADRRGTSGDSACGGALYSHIEYGRQLRLKSEIIADAFRRIGRQTLEHPVPVLASPESGYRLRARLHLAQGRAGFFREGTHLLCDARATGQLLPAASDAVDQLLQLMGSRSDDYAAILIAENVAADQRVLHLEPEFGRAAGSLEWAKGASGIGGLTGLTTSPARGLTVLFGTASVTDTTATLIAGDHALGSIMWTRHATSFFQSNRFLAGALLSGVLAATEGRDRIADLYAGVGLFSLPLAARGAQVLAVENDQSSVADLDANAAPFRSQLDVVRGSVEDVLAEQPREPPDAIVLDPPRTGVSPRALADAIEWQSPRVVYVSCDPPTLARDAAALVAAGYRLTSIQAFDFFPNAPHVETLAVFDR